MRHILIIIVFLFNSLNLFSQTDSLKELIISSLKIYESNPTQKAKSENLNQKFEGILRDTGDTNIMEIFDLLYDNAYSSFEDSDDTRRTKMRQSLCYSTIALLADKDRFDYFINLAKYSIADSTSNPIEFLDEPYCALGLLDIYIKTKYNIDFQVDVADLNDRLEKYKANLSTDFYDKTEQILKKLKK